jgi:hypothetical protein
MPDEKLNPESARDLVAKSARGMVRAKVFEAVDQVRRGKPREFPNPFTGQMTTMHVSPAVASFAERLRAAGLHENAAFMDSFQAFMLDVASTPLFSFFTALDGEDAFEEELQVELRLASGDAIAGGLHEVLYPIYRDEDQPD